LRVGEIVRSRNIWMLINCGNPGLENLLPLGEYKVAKTGDGSNRRSPLSVTSRVMNVALLVFFGGQYLRALRLKYYA